MKKKPERPLEKKENIADLIVRTAVWNGENDPKKMCEEYTLWELKEIAEMLGIYDDEEDRRELPVE